MTDDPSPSPATTGSTETTGSSGASPSPGTTAPAAPPELPELLVGAARALRHAWVRALEPHGLSPHQARALRAVTSAAAGLRVSDLASALRIVPRSATEVADGLEEQRLVVRVADPADRRAVVLRATDAGREVSQRVEQVRVGSGEVLLARLDERDRTELARLLRLLLAEDATGAGHRPGGPSG